jgi:RNA recognition motif-containing protein
MAKGLAYVDFDSEQAAQEAVNSNGIMVDGRKLFVALSDPPKKGYFLAFYLILENKMIEPCSSTTWPSQLMSRRYATTSQTS